MFKRTGHLTDEELICFVDGETTQSASSRIRKHLAVCADCSSRKQGFESAASEFAAFHHATIDPQIQSGTQSHNALKAQLDARHAPQKSLRERFSTATPSRPWLYLYATVAIVALSLTVRDQQSHLFKPQFMPAQLESRLLPDHGLTPGATRPVELADICSEQDNDLDPAVSPSAQKVVFQEYGIPNAPAGSYQVDYLINPQLGGTDDVRNLWPEPYGSKVWNAHLKDALEDRLHNMVCSQQIDLASAQYAIATNWIAAYKKYFHTEKPA
jgi:hypothetical protein